ncbi:hypothetical protein BST61_g5010 [Cercospora zeina]
MLKEHLSSGAPRAEKYDYEVKSGDRVAPFHFLDEDPEYQSSVALLSLRYDAVLDTQHMLVALVKLFNRKEWHPLGGRIRHNKNGKLEHHIPVQYTHERPAFNWAVDKHETDIQVHPIASRIPAGGPRTVPTIYSGIENWKHFLYPTEKLPWKLDDFLSRDISPISVQIHAFNDATLLTLGFHHCVLDAIGGSHLLQTWAAIVAEREDEVKEFREEPERDVVREIIDSGRVKPENYLFHSQRLKGFTVGRFLFSLLYESISHPHQDWRTFCLPASFVAALKTQATADVEGRFLSEGDVISAWRNRIIAQALKLKPSKKIMMLQYYTLYGVLDELPAGKAHTGNSIAKMFAMTTVGDMLGQPLGKVALSTREALSKQRTKEQAEAFLAIQAKHTVMLFGAGSQIMLGTSNVARAGLFRVDFSSAIIPSANTLSSPSLNEKVDCLSNFSTKEEKSRITCSSAEVPSRGTPACVHIAFHIGVPFSLRNVGPIIGKDADGNWWLSWEMRSSAWIEVERLLARSGGVKVI